MKKICKIVTEIFLKDKKLRVILIGLIVASCILLTYSWKTAINITEREAIKIAETASAGISNTIINNFTTEKNLGILEKDQSYKDLKKALSFIANIDNDITFSYILIKTGDKIRILADSEEFNSKDYSPPGDYYFEASEEYFEAFELGETIITKANRDRWGIWRSVLVPIFDENGKVMAVFGLDYDHEVWHIYAKIQTIQAVIISLAVMLAAIALYFFIYQNKELRLERQKLIESEKKLKESEILFRSVFEQATIGIAIGNSQKNIATIIDGRNTINPMFQKILNRSADELKTMNWDEITHPEDLKKDLDYFYQFQKGEIDGYDMEKRYLRADGSYVWVHMMVSFLNLDLNDTKKHLCLIEDITKQKDKEMKLKYISEHNTLTGLYNRAYFEQVLREESSHIHDKKRAVVLVNIKKFNLLNITYGYFYAENIIKILAKELEKLNSDNISLFHIAIDRFIFYINGYDARIDLDEICSKINALIKNVIEVYNIKASVGVVELSGNYVSSEDLLKKAAIAVEGNFCSVGSRCCYFDASMEKTILRKEAIKNELSSISRGMNENSLFVVYQPIINLKNKTVYGFEALARFKSKSFGLISPIEFIPIAEETQLIVPLGKIIMKKSFEFLNILNKELSLELKMSVNVSGIQLLRDDFLKDLENLIIETEVIKSNIKLEITESFFSNDLDEINHRIGLLKNMGISVAIDDFGTGYSSFSRERELDVDCLKLDKSFIDTLLSVEEEKAITADVISMAHKLGHYVIAEGVECESQETYLLKYGCDFVQGYLYSKPLLQEDAFDYIKQY